MSRSFRLFFRSFFRHRINFPGAVRRDRGSPLPGGMLSRLGGPRTVLDPAGCVLIRRRYLAERSARARRLWLCARFAFQGRQSVRSLLVGSLKPPDRDVEISHGAKLGVKPLQFGPDFASAGSATIGEKNEMAVRNRASAIAFDAALQDRLCMSRHDLRSNPQDSGAPPPERPYRMPSPG